MNWLDRMAVTAEKRICLDIESARRLARQTKLEISSGQRRPIPLPNASEFFALTDTSAGEAECWPWLGKTNRQGYGIFNHNGCQQGAHRIAYLLSTGFWPRVMNKHVIRHLCHNPKCCNPQHLLVGTRGDNKWDDYLRQLGIDLVDVRLRVEALSPSYVRSAA